MTELTLLNMTKVEARVALLEQKVGALEKARPGRKGAPVVAPHQPGVCALDPSRDSALCPSANVYRHQQGCRGVLCVDVNTDYYTKFRAKDKKAQEVIIDE